jgi:hypothetical protein
MNWNTVREIGSLMSDPENQPLQFSSDEAVRRVAEALGMEPDYWLGVAKTAGNRADAALAALAASVAREATALAVVRDLRQKLATAGVEGSPPPGETTIGAWTRRAREAEAREAAMRGKLMAAREVVGTNAPLAEADDYRNLLEQLAVMPHRCIFCGLEVGGVPKRIHGSGCLFANTLDKHLERHLRSRAGGGGR